MTDHPKKGPIKIPITFVDTEPKPPHEDMAAFPPEEDVIELEADLPGTGGLDEEETPAAVEAEEAPAAFEAAPAEDALDAGAETPAQAAAEPEPVEVEVEAPQAVAEARTPAPLAEEPAAPPPRPAAEVPLEAFIRRGQEIQQKAEQIERLQAEKKELHDMLLRKQAEFENFRKRTEREAQEMYRRVRGDVLLDLLPVLDNYELAIRHAEQADATTLREGVALIYKQLIDILSRQGLEAIEAEGRHFDPEIHEAVAVEASEDVEEHTVLQELQRGYKLGDRLLRPARVKVAVQPQQ
jgi:molecular chaperone GrpE